MPPTPTRSRAPSPRALARAASLRTAWTWGRGSHRTRGATLAAPPPRVAVVLSIRVTEYREAKGGPIADTWRHDHAPPFPLLVRAPRAPSEPTRSARDVPRVPPGGALYQLGELVAFEGDDARGRPVRIEVRRGALDLAGDSRGRMHIVRRTQSGTRQFWIATNGSPYRLTDRGIVR